MKIGTVVKCVSNRFHSRRLTVGRLYIIIQYDTDVNIIQVVDDTIRYRWVNVRNFESYPHLPAELLTKLGELNESR